MHLDLNISILTSEVSDWIVVWLWLKKSHYDSVTDLRYQDQDVWLQQAWNFKLYTRILHHLLYINTTQDTTGPIW